MDPASHDPLHVDLHLSGVRDLFVAPDGDPFDPNYLDVSGMEELVNQLGPHRLMHATPRITLYLPPDQLTPTLAAETRAVLDRHLARCSRWSRNEMLATRYTGWRALGYALVLSVAVLALLGVVHYLAMPQWVQALAYAVFIVVAWVSMWWAVETLLFDWLANRREITIYAAIQRAELRILPEPSQAVDSFTAP
jgi:hypothetical protein